MRNAARRVEQSRAENGFPVGGIIVHEKTPGSAGGLQSKEEMFLPSQPIFFYIDASLSSRGLGREFLKLQTQVRILLGTPYYFPATLFSDSSAAFNVFSISVSVCAVDINAASNCEGAR